MLQEDGARATAHSEFIPHTRHTDLIHYVMDLEALVRWFALMYAYEDQDGTPHQNEPIWTVYDERGTYLAENDRLQRTWRKVMDG